MVVLFFITISEKPWSMKISETVIYGEIIRHVHVTECLNVE